MENINTLHQSLQRKEVIYKMKVYITGDLHGDFARLNKIVKKEIRTSSKSDVLIVLGDSGFNYYENDYDRDFKRLAQELPITIFCIHGNHEQRPSEIPSYHETEFLGGKVWAELNYPNILFAKDGEIYDFNGKSTIVIGGAYSVDKYYRLIRGAKWWSNEQPSEKIKEYVEQQLDNINWNVDYVLSHTGPKKYEPVEFFLPMVDQDAVDKTTEEWLDNIEEKLNYEAWYFGHYHCDKSIDKMRIMYRDVDFLI